MGNHRNRTGTLVLCSLLLASCAADGGLASKTKPLDKEATRLAICEGAQRVDIAWHSLPMLAAKVSPEVSDVETTFIATVGFKPGIPEPAAAETVCAKQYTGDLDVAINTAVLATVNISQMIQAWNK